MQSHPVPYLVHNSRKSDQIQDAAFAIEIEVWAVPCRGQLGSVLTSVIKYDTGLLGPPVL